MNPFSGMLGDYAVIMGNTGGDNRVEFGTRLDHSIWFESPKMVDGLISFDVLISPGANRTYDNVVQSAGSPDCSGGNTPGSGNLPENCDDGGFGTAYSADLKFEYGRPLCHRGVGTASRGQPQQRRHRLQQPVLRLSHEPRQSDHGRRRVAAASTGAPTTRTSPSTDRRSSTPTASRRRISPTSPTNGRSRPACSTCSISDFPISGIYEYMHRNLPADLEFQNERQRNGLWFAMSQDFTPRDNFSIGWAHAGRTPGDPGGQHNYNPTNTEDYANMFTAAWKHRFDKSLYWYLDAADTINHGNAHYDLGAGGRGADDGLPRRHQHRVHRLQQRRDRPPGAAAISSASRPGLNYKF